MSACGSPISWLRLEEYVLGESAASDVEVIARHLESCAACAEVLARIKEDDAARALPPLPPRATVRGIGSVWITRGVVIGSSLALAAAVLLAVGRRPRDADELAREKGDGIAFTLVREDDALVPEAGGSYRDQERFKALVTCAPGARVGFDVAVYEEGSSAPAFPLAPSVDIACGNSVPLAGAFRVTGRATMNVCLVWDPDGIVDREVVRRSRREDLAHAICTTLRPAD